MKGRLKFLKEVNLIIVTLCIPYLVNQTDGRKRVGALTMCKVHDKFELLERI